MSADFVCSLTAIGKSAVEDATCLESVSVPASARFLEFEMFEG